MLLLNYTNRFISGFIAPLLIIGKPLIQSIEVSFLQKLLSYGINGKMFIVIKDIYDKAKSCLMKDNMRSEYFMCSMGVRQGDNLSPCCLHYFKTILHNT